MSARPMMRPGTLTVDISAVSISQSKTAGTWDLSAATSMSGCRSIGSDSTSMSRHFSEPEYWPL